MAQFYSIDRANARIGEVRDLLLLLRSQRAELIRLRDEYVDLTGGSEATGESGGSDGGPEDVTSSGTTPTRLARARVVKLRIKAIVDQMGASVARIDGWGITLREIETGLIDFPALVNGRQVWLCWRLGEDEVEWWHELDTGLAGRQRLTDLH